MTLAVQPSALPLWQRLFFKIPVLGWVAKDLLFGDKNNVWFALIGFVSLWLSSALTFGLPGLYLPALALVPVVFVVLLLITKG
ncbi:hypothetical protein So717_04740 [Roseobacter cerasinus]|uniref:Uncharacterized protein n=1 Tax=Roseobacter cerasinus TaxID=2602289 RepID=A0A640VNQ6_9RHOB|nr:hypothetical protein [Roseobacter cerasinus]GFE48721.1 hypothetical protein So717_04740 [Roseobacter cerasinus]